MMSEITKQEMDLLKGAVDTIAERERLNHVDITEESTWELFRRFLLELAIERHMEFL